LQNMNFARWLSKACPALACALLFAVWLPAQAPSGQVPAPEQPGEKATPVKPTQISPAQNVPAFREVKDELGRTVRVPQPVERIVSLAPNLTETLYALGLQDHLVGDTDYCDYPADAQKKPKVGGAINPSIEEIAALRPDLVLIASINRFETLRALDDLKIPTYATDPHTVQEIISSTAKLGDVLGAAAAGVTLASDLEQRLTDLQHRIEEFPERRVLFVVWTDPLITIGQGTFIADALRKAGAISIVQSTQDWPQVSLEEVVRLQPDFLIFATKHEESMPAEVQTLAARPGWRGLEAVRNGRFVVVSEALDRPAPRIVSAIEDLARQLHPEAFEKAPPSVPTGEVPKKETPDTDQTPEKKPIAGSKSSKTTEWGPFEN